MAYEIEDDFRIPPSSAWAKLPLIGFGLAALGLAGTFATVGTNREHIMFAWLFAFMTALSIPLGCLAFVMIQHVVRAGWSAVVRRVAENTAMVLPLFALAFIPVVIGMHDIFPWTHEPLDHVLNKKAPYLNQTFFLVRAGGYFLVWTLLAWALHSRSVALDRGRDARIVRSLWKISTLGIPLYALSQSFAAFDWLMSLQPHWYSTMFGVYYFAGSMLGAYAFMTLILMRLQASGLIKEAVTVEHYHDMGKFIFGHTVFWAYIAFSQFMLIWYGGMPEETEFFIHRLHHGWEGISYAMPITHFFLPFFFLLSRHIKRSKTALAAGAVYTLIVHAIDIWWLVMPNVGAHGGSPEHMGQLVWIDIAALIGAFGILLGGLGIFMNRSKLLAAGDPRLQESLAHENY